CFFFFQAEDGIRDRNVTGVQTCALPILARQTRARAEAMLDRYAAYTAGVPGEVDVETTLRAEVGRADIKGRVDRVERLGQASGRSEERRVGRECRCGGRREGYRTQGETS